MRFEGLSPEAASNVLAANIVNATAPTRRRLWEPQNEPMRIRDYVGLTILTAAGVVAFVFLWGATP